MDYIQGTPREQSLLFPEVIDDYITKDNPVRFIDAFVDSLDLEDLGFQRSQPALTGRPPYDPGDLLKLYIYGYLNRIRSSRRLEKEASRNVELMWLLRKLIPDFKTIADFRKDNNKAFKHVFRQFTLLCRELDLFGGELLAIDGSKFKAVNSKHRNFTKSKLKKRLEEIDAKIEKYMIELDAADQEEADVSKPTKEELREKIQQLAERKDRYDELMGGMEAKGEKQVSLTDPDSRSMPKSPKVDVGYNVQIAVDDKHKLIVEHPFGTMKHWNDQGYFLMKGLKKVRAEMSLSALVYNINRVINILGVKQMIEALALGSQGHTFMLGFSALHYKKCS